MVPLKLPNTEVESEQLCMSSPQNAGRFTKQFPPTMPKRRMGQILVDTFTFSLYRLSFLSKGALA